ncbi:hypothetical protein V8E36_008538 [Tilletia maclaganii]
MAVFTKPAPKPSAGLFYTNSHRSTFLVLTEAEGRPGHISATNSNADCCEREVTEDDQRRLQLAHCSEMKHTEVWWHSILTERNDDSAILPGWHEREVGSHPVLIAANLSSDVLFSCWFAIDVCLLLSAARSARIISFVPSLLATAARSISRSVDSAGGLMGVFYFTSTASHEAGPDVRAWHRRISVVRGRGRFFTGGLSEVLFQEAT